MQETDKDIFAKDAQDYQPVFNRYKIVLDHGEGAYLWDINGKKYLDFLGGIAVNVLGHDYGPLVTAISEQAKKLIHCSNLYYTQPQADAAAKLVAFFNHSGTDETGKYSVNVLTEFYAKAFLGHTLGTLQSRVDEHSLFTH